MPRKRTYMADITELLFHSMLGSSRRRSDSAALATENLVSEEPIMTARAIELAVRISVAKNFITVIFSFSRLSGETAVSPTVLR